MTTKYAAFYVPTDVSKPIEVNETVKQRIYNELCGVKSKLGKGASYYDLKRLSAAMSVTAMTEFTQKNVTAALTYVMQGKAIKSEAMLDELFNTFAPALNMSLTQTSYNSLAEMRTAMKSGTVVNAANFIEGLSAGFAAFVEDNAKISYSKYGEEIPIDVVTSLKYSYSSEAPKHRTLANTEKLDYIAMNNVITLIVNGHFKNENAELWSANELSNKIVDLMINKKLVYFRAGKSIYENCVIKKYTPQIENIYDISFEAEIYIEQNTTIASQKYGNTRIMNPRKPLWEYDRDDFDMIR